MVVVDGSAGGGDSFLLALTSAGLVALEAIVAQTVEQADTALLAVWSDGTRTRRWRAVWLAQASVPTGRGRTRRGRRRRCECEKRHLLAAGILDEKDEAAFKVRAVLATVGLGATSHPRALARRCNWRNARVFSDHTHGVGPIGCQRRVWQEKAIVAGEVFRTRFAPCQAKFLLCCVEWTCTKYNWRQQRKHGESKHHRSCQKKHFSTIAI
jgi:hypothetical protein